MIICTHEASQWYLLLKGKVFSVLGSLVEICNLGRWWHSQWLVTLRFGTAALVRTRLSLVCPAGLEFCELLLFFHILESFSFTHLVTLEEKQIHSKPRLVLFFKDGPSLFYVHGGLGTLMCL